MTVKDRKIIFNKKFREDLRWWFKTDKKNAFKILDLIESATEDPFQGIGKPEPLKYVAPGVWSRRITQEHRLVYRVTDLLLEFLQARYHY